MKKSILILVILMASCCLYAQSWPKRTLTKNDSSVYNNVNDTGKVINNNAVVDNSFNKIETNANSSENDTGRKKIHCRRPAAYSANGGFRPIPIPPVNNTKKKPIQNDTIIEKK